MKKLSLLTLLVSLFFLSFAQEKNNDSTTVRLIFDEALANGNCYETLSSLCLDVGNRLSGTPAADKAVEWAQSQLQNIGFGKVYLQEIKVPVWVRGDRESAKLWNGSSFTNLNILTLGGSVSTNGELVANVVEVQSLKELERLGKEKLEGKIVFFNRPMDPKYINTFESYGACVDQRYWGAAEAGKYGVKAVLVRSMTLLENDEFPHTGSMGYPAEGPKIPAAALSTKAANFLHEQLKQNNEATIHMDINPSYASDKVSYNVIAEVQGTENPDNYIVVGGHLDSWDVGQGAHDDGAGVVHSMEILRIYKALNIRPKNTLRVVLFMNEENGNRGGKSYASIAREKNEKHIFGIESDRGGFSPRGFTIESKDSSMIAQIRTLKNLLEPYGIHNFPVGYSGVDIHPLASKSNLVDADLVLLGLLTDSQRYFDIHHTADDNMDKINKRELELGCASMAAMVYLLDKTLK
jgi:carboxypeptidase Q